VWEEVYLIGPCSNRDTWRIHLIFIFILFRCPQGGFLRGCVSFKKLGFGVGTVLVGFLFWGWNVQLRQGPGTRMLWRVCLYNTVVVSRNKPKSNRFRKSSCGYQDLLFLHPDNELSFLRNDIQSMTWPPLMSWYRCDAIEYHQRIYQHPYPTKQNPVGLANIHSMLYNID